MSDEKVRMRITLNGIVHWLVRVEADGAVRVDVNPKLAAMFDREAAREQTKRLRAKDPLNQIAIIAANGVEVFAEESAPQPTVIFDDRVPCYDEETKIRIVPGADNCWYVRFPDSPFESVKGRTAEEAFSKFTQHPWFLKMLPFAERKGE